jgi:flagellar motility protein MotE (MotC chaperone)
MQNMQEVFDKIQELKKTSKEIGKEYRDALSQTGGYQETQEEIKKLREKKKMLETGVQAEMGSRYEDLEKTKREIESLNQMLTDIAMSTLMKGESINLKDQYDVQYEPSYKITFKKIG